jgi:hypothetical protein
MPQLVDGEQFQVGAGGKLRNPCTSALFPDDLKRQGIPYTIPSGGTVTSSREHAGRHNQLKMSWFPAEKLSEPGLHYILPEALPDPLQALL